MNKQETIFFKALSQDRSESADMLEKPSMRGIKNSVVEKYSDQAHFIYELLQNADDAKATYARFILEPNQLIFAHNGTRHFSVSNPADEDQDSQEGTLGDINAITSIANSNKTEASIGKFGVGFKAVFQYTSTPYIYDSEYCFKIDRFIVPTLLDNDFPRRRPEETLFVFPFNHPERNATEAYNDISDKLKNLSYPLLFLSYIKNIEFKFNNTVGQYNKEINETHLFDETIAEQIDLSQNSGDEFHNQNLWLFSRTDENNHRFSVGFFMNNDGKLCPISEPAFCFFPTKEVTGLNFIIHAPFLLTDSREGIRAGVSHNDKMLQRLASLSADALVFLRDIGKQKNNRLIDDSIIDIIPINSELFSNPDDHRKVSFLPFFKSIHEKFTNDRLLPTIDGYVETKNAYWASVPQLPQLFNNEQLSVIVENKEAKWVFISLGRDEIQQKNNKSLLSYLDSLVRTYINEDNIINGRSRDFYFYQGIRHNLENIKGITPEYIETQNIEWLHNFYKWLSETKHRTDIVTNKPIFLDQERKAAAAYDKAGQSILFMPAEDISGYKVVHSDLLRNSETKLFLVQIGIKQPSLKDHIYNIILPMYQNGVAINTEPHFKLFFKYFCECSNTEVNEFIKLIKDYEFLTYHTKVNPQTYRGAANSMYLPTPELQNYFATKPSVRFIELDKYINWVGKEQENHLFDFLLKLGIRNEISINHVELDYNSSGRKDLPHPYSTQYIIWSENIIDGCKELVDYTVKKHDIKKSIVLWNCLLKIIETKCTSWNCNDLNSLLKGKCEYFYHKERIEYFTSSDALRLKEEAWLVDNTGKFVSAKNVSKLTLSSEYDITSETAQSLLKFLGIADDKTITEGDDDTYLTDSQKEKIEFANKLQAMGINEDDLEDFQEFKRLKEARKHKEDKQTSMGSNSDHNSIINKTQINDISNDVFLDNIDDNDNTDTFDPEKTRLDKTTNRVLKDIVQRAKRKTLTQTSSSNNIVDDNENVDHDEYNPVLIDYNKQIETAKQKSVTEIEKIVYYEELQTKAIRSTKYSYVWFNTLLEMESINNKDANSNYTEVSITFAKVEREQGTKRTLLLKQPNRHIPQFIEDLADIPLVFHIGELTKTVIIEVANVKSYTLRVKLKSNTDIDGIDLSAVTSSTIDTKSPAFLLEELRKQYIELGKKLKLEYNYNMQKNLCENIEFIFGPPGTGKTTYLAQNVISPLMQVNSDCKVLVLTPTNKSADVLIRKIMDVSKEACYNWLVRFGATGDEEIEQSPIFQDKTFDIKSVHLNVTVTTIARFSYDYFYTLGEKIYLRDINWDYIVIDEASMIPIANIVLPLYMKSPHKFIIAGDPFQIEPITSVDLWKNENIYTMVNLESFTHPKTTPYQYNVKLLTTQYRSIPDIGYVFSNFLYGGILKNHRITESQRPLKIRQDLNIKTFNIIKFPISKYESIYRCKRLQQSSSYQVYSALFSFEYICYLSRIIAENNPNCLFKIGVIAPYRAQADMIDKLLAFERLPKEVDVQVGTIHSFQGDECDIIFAIFNPPPTISTSNEMFLNKRNIINVSISRAKDYLFIVMPDDNTENITNLYQIKRIEQLIHDTNAYHEFMSSDIEELMFGDPKFLENNTFSTSHQNVNVYSLPEKCYEVRAEDAAVDIQIHKNTFNQSLDSSTVEIENDVEE